jgi:hypothetical protein
VRELVVILVSFCFEFLVPEIFYDVCQGKLREYGMERYLEALRYCSQLGLRGPWTEPWVTNGEIIAGLEPPASSIRAIEWITGVGAIPTVCVFRPLAGTDYSRVPPPDAVSLVPVFRALYESCMSAGLPIGCAPNVHVSLVMLPEEARFLSPRRFPWAEAKRRVLATVVSRVFAQRQRRITRRAS